MDKEDWEAVFNNKILLVCFAVIALLVLSMIASSYTGWTLDDWLLGELAPMWSLTGFGIVLCFMVVLFALWRRR